MTIDPRILFSVAIFLAVAPLVYWISRLLTPDPLQRRLKRHEAQLRELQEKPADLSRFWIRATRLAAPFIPKEQQNLSRLRRQLFTAGLYQGSALEIFIAIKILSMLIGAMLAWLMLRQADPVVKWIFVYLGFVVGYVAPAFWLSRQTRSRQAMIERGLPDALDLMVVCTESGMTVDASLQRVGRDIALAHPVITQEFGITYMESALGVSREAALRNMGHRTESSALKSLASMLIQAERFGTGIAEALRVYAESLREKRMHEAEEKAVKTTVKLAFPVVLCIFPTLVLVLGGPAYLMMMNSPAFS